MVSWSSPRPSAAGTLQLDARIDSGPLEQVFPTGSADSTAALLGAIAGATITLTALVATGAPIAIVHGDVAMSDEAVSRHLTFGTALGHGSARLRSAVARMLEDVATVARPEHRALLLDRLRALDDGMPTAA